MIRQAAAGVLTLAVGLVRRRLAGLRSTFDRLRGRAPAESFVAEFETWGRVPPG